MDSSNPFHGDACHTTDFNGYSESDLNFDWLDDIFAPSPIENGVDDVTKNDVITNDNVYSDAFDYDWISTIDSLHSHVPENDSNDNQFLEGYEQSALPQYKCRELQNSDIQQVELASLPNLSPSSECDAIDLDANNRGQGEDTFWTWTELSPIYQQRSKENIRRPVRIMKLPQHTICRKHQSEHEGKPAAKFPKSISTNFQYCRGSFDYQPNSRPNCRGGFDTTKNKYKYAYRSNVSHRSLLQPECFPSESDYKGEVASEHHVTLGTCNKVVLNSSGEGAVVYQKKSMDFVQHAPYNLVSRTSPSLRNTRSLILSEMPSDGVILLTDEEKNMLTLEGYPIPTKLPLNKQEEKHLKQIRRRIKNKISAQESRRKKNEYLDSLEIKMQIFGQERAGLLTKVQQLESNNRSLMQQLKSLQRLVQTTTESRSTGTTCLMVLVLFFGAFVGTWSPMNSWSIIGYSPVLGTQQPIQDLCYVGFGPYLPRLINLPTPDESLNGKVVDTVKPPDCINGFVASSQGKLLLNDHSIDLVKSRPFCPTVPPIEITDDPIVNSYTDADNIDDYVPGHFSRPTDPRVPWPESGRYWSDSHSCFSFDKERGKCVGVVNQTLIRFSVEPIQPLPSASVSDNLKAVSILIREIKSKKSIHAV